MAEISGRPSRSRGRRAGRGPGGRVSGFADGLAAWLDAGGQRDGHRPTGSSVRRCPYCAEYIDLRRCDVVSAARPLAYHPSESGFDNLGPAAGNEGSPGEWTAGGREQPKHEYELLLDAHAGRNANPSASLIQELLGNGRTANRLEPVGQLAPPQKIPRRVCELCHRLLPPELDDLDTKILAVVGVTGAGKTHFLARALTDAARRGTLLRFGCSEFAPTDADQTAHILHNDYYAPVVRRRELFPPTNPTERPTQFTFTVMVEHQRFLLVTHDIAGESLTDPAMRAQQLTFLRRADALVFLLDPVEFDQVRAVLPDGLAGQDKPADQVHLLRQCLRELDQSNSSEVPVRVVVAKSDLLSAYCGVTGRWEQPPASRWSDDIGSISADVERVLAGLGETEVLRLLAGRDRKLFHAVSALGAPPGQDGLLVPAEPLRCADPLGTALLGMARQPAASA